MKRINSLPIFGTRLRVIFQPLRMLVVSYNSFFAKAEPILGRTQIEVTNRSSTYFQLTRLNQLLTYSALLF